MRIKWKCLFNKKLFNLFSECSLGGWEEKLLSSLFEFEFPCNMLAPAPSSYVIFGSWSVLPITPLIWHKRVLTLILKIIWKIFCCKFSYYKVNYRFGLCLKRVILKLKLVISLVSFLLDFLLYWVDDKWNIVHYLLLFKHIWEISLWGEISKKKKLQ